MGLRILVLEGDVTGVGHSISSSLRCIALIIVASSSSLSRASEYIDMMYQCGRERANAEWNMELCGNVPS